MTKGRTRMPFPDQWEIWEHEEPRETTYPILYWCKLAPSEEGKVREVEVRRVEWNPEGEILPAEHMVKGPLFPLDGFLNYYDVATAYE